MMWSWELMESGRNCTRKYASVGWKTLFASKPCGAPIFCVIVPSIYQLTNKIL
jgi:hypothetical protein